MTEEVEEMADPAPINVQKLSGETETQLIVHKLSGETEAKVIAPLTPVTQSAPLRFNEVHETPMAHQMRLTTSSESRQRTIFPIRVVDLEEIHSEAGPSSLGEDNKENALFAKKLLAITKSVGGYLYNSFLHRKEKGEEEAVYLSQILKQKTKKESARFFYQTLVLKTGGYIDVKQEKPYDEICVKQTQKLKEAFGGGGRE